MRASHLRAEGFVAAALIAVATPDILAQPVFTWLSDLPEATSALARTASADGSVVIGWTLTDQARAVRWVNGTPQLIPMSVNGQSYASGVSSDGSVVVGVVGVGTFAPRAYRWVAGGPAAPVLNAAPGTLLLTDVTGVSGDGLAVVGNGKAINPQGGALSAVAGRWTAPTGGQPLGWLPGAATSQAESIARDGSAIFGSSGSAFGDAFRWTAAKGMQSLGPLPGGITWLARCPSNGGSILSGAAGTSAVPVWWSQATGPQYLSLLPDTASASVSEMSADGTIMVGQTYLHNGPQAVVATIWTPEGGVQKLRAFLLDRYGLQLPASVYLVGAQGISADKRTIVGYGSDGFQQRAWSIRFPTPVGCYANCDASTAAPILNVSDYVCFNNRFVAGDERANCDQSSVAPLLNVSDFICFMNRFAEGCP